MKVALTLAIGTETTSCQAVHGDIPISINCSSASWCPSVANVGAVFVNAMGRGLVGGLPTCSTHVWVRNGRTGVCLACTPAPQASVVVLPFGSPCLGHGAADHDRSQGGLAYLGDPLAPEENRATLATRCATSVPGPKWLLPMVTSLMPLRACAGSE